MHLAYSQSGPALLRAVTTRAQQQGTGMPARLVIREAGLGFGGTRPPSACPGPY